MSRLSKLYEAMDTLRKEGGLQNSIAESRNYNDLRDIITK